MRVLERDEVDDRKNFERWFSTVSGPIHYEIRDLQITASADVAFCHCLSHVQATRTNGENADDWADDRVRVTVACRSEMASG